MSNKTHRKYKASSLLATLILSVIMVGCSHSFKPPAPIKWPPDQLLNMSRVSISTGKRQANHLSQGGTASYDGRYVTFDSHANNLVSLKNNRKISHVYVRDRAMNTTTIISIGNKGELGDFHSYSPSISADGRYIAFSSKARNLDSCDTSWTQVFLYDKTKKRLKCITIQNKHSSITPTISANGKYVAYTTVYGIFRYNVDTGKTIKITSATGEASINNDGSKIVFDSLTGNLVPGDKKDLVRDVYFIDLRSGTKTKITKGANKDSIRPKISSDGRKVVFESTASNLVDGDKNGVSDIFLYDIITKRTSNITIAGNGRSQTPSISSDGNKIAFTSTSDNLAGLDKNNDMDVFVYDASTMTIKYISKTPHGDVGNNSSFSSEISGNGDYVVFVSKSTDLVAADTNKFRDTFVAPTR